MDIVLATANPHKVAEIREIFSRVAPAVRLLSLNEVGGPFAEPPEHGKTFGHNAVIKAFAYSDLTRKTCLADDSGLEVDALGGKPGVISSHYCTDGRETGMSREERDRRNNERLLAELTGVEAVKRSARFVCVMVLATRGRIEAMAEGTFEGRIGIPPRVPRGRDGFGYDPLFLVGPEFEETSAELTPEQKNRASHRAAAAFNMANILHGLTRPNC